MCQAYEAEKIGMFASERSARQRRWAELMSIAAERPLTDAEHEERKLLQVDALMAMDAGY